jgi:hypothetical protein
MDLQKPAFHFCSSSNLWESIYCRYVSIGLDYDEDLNSFPSTASPLRLWIFRPVCLKVNLFFVFRDHQFRPQGTILGRKKLFKIFSLNSVSLLN